MNTGMNAGTDTGPTVLATARFPGADGAPPAPLAGFIASSFAPLVGEVADRCLSSHYGAPPLVHPVGERTAVLLVSTGGDLETAAAVARVVDDGARMQPLLFFQSVPNAVAGRVAARWNLAGPVVCTSPVGDPLADGLAVADLLLQDGDADQVLLLLVEQACADGSADRAEALLLAAPAPPPTEPRTEHFSHLSPLSGGTA